MTLEATLERIAVALETIAANRAPVQSAAPVAAPAPVAAVKKPVEVEIPVLVPPKVETLAPTMNVVPSPTPSTTAPVVTSAASSNCPITSGKELMDYVMGVYKQLGPQKGAAIQNVLNTLGCQAINEVRPDQYAALYAGLEQLKAA